MGCLDILPQFLQLFMKYLTILDCIIMALDYIYTDGLVQHCDMSSELAFTFCDISFVCIFLCFISVFCYGPRDGKGTCNAKDGNPFGPFWDTFNIDFDDSQFYKGMSIDTLVKGAPEQWNKK